MEGQVISPPERSLIFVGDPMCSWCWGFAPVMGELAALCAEREIPVDVLVGGLRPGTTEPMDDRALGYISHHWHEVHKTTGQPFDFEALERRRAEGFVYDTEPACRAVVTVRSAAPALALPYFEALHRAFYAEGRDVTATDILAELAEGLGVPRDSFMTVFEDEAARNATLVDFEASRRLGVQGFPTLILREGTTGGLLSAGYQPIETLRPAVEAWLDGNAPVKKPDA
ncbi:MAG: DsbA family protein [Rhodospirillales bacterium]|nr:DsbA family protein [Rhodospirillales bacterium]